MVEYAITIVGVVITGIISISYFGNEVSLKFTEAQTAIYENGLVESGLPDGWGGGTKSK